MSNKTNGKAATRSNEIKTLIVGMIIMNVTALEQSESFMELLGNYSLIAGNIMASIVFFLRRYATAEKIDSWTTPKEQSTPYEPEIKEQ
jgi:purine-cytosine permease-like protein